MKPVRWRHATPTHSELVLSIIQYLGYLGYYAWPSHNPRTRPAKKGIPDITATKGNRTIYVEVKIGDDKLSEDQIETHRELAEKGCEVIVARGLDDLIGKV